MQRQRRKQSPSSCGTKQLCSNSAKKRLPCQDTVCESHIRSLARPAQARRRPCTHPFGPLYSTLSARWDAVRIGLQRTKQPKGRRTWSSRSRELTKARDLPLTVAGTASLFENDRNAGLPHGFMPCHITGTASLTFPFSRSKREIPILSSTQQEN